MTYIMLFQVKRGGEFLYFIDAYDESTSNWLRWLNASRHSKEENVKYLTCRSKAYYITFKDVYPGQELLVYYGEVYAYRLHIDVENYYNNEVDMSVYRKYACWNVKE